MSEQMRLFDSTRDPQGRPATAGGVPALDRLQGALVFSAVGDALGWPTEFIRDPATLRSRFGTTRLTDFVRWQKTVGGRYWGYPEPIPEGSYSDDTQLTLCVARCLDEAGEFDPEKFASFELPLWLTYEKGGGRSIKAAARSIAGTKKPWMLNFYRRKAEHGQYLDYRLAGANGAAMRVMPIALVNPEDADRADRDAFLNAIATHGHPRAILGAVIYTALLRLLLSQNESRRQPLIDYVRSVVADFAIPTGHDDIGRWVCEWDKLPPQGCSFSEVLQHGKQEALEYADGIERLANAKDDEYYSFVGAIDGPLRGSGLSTVFVAAYLFSKYLEDPEKALIEAVNRLGSDTDTIGYFVGGLFGARYGLSAVPTRLADRLQDRDYFLKVASQLHNVVAGKALTEQTQAEKFTRGSALLRLYAWEIGLHELFWDALGQGERLVHPALGPGVITAKDVVPLKQRPDYVVKRISIAFECGQTCVFHSRVARDGTVSESLSSELKRALA